MADVILIEVAFALPQRQSLLSVSVPVDATVRSAIESSGILRMYPEIDLTQHKVGIWRPDGAAGRHFERRRPD